MRIAPVYRKHTKQPLRKLDVSLLPYKATKLESMVSDGINHLQDSSMEDLSVNTKWGQISSVMYIAAKEILGHPKRQHADWFDQNDMDLMTLIDEVRACCQQYLTGMTTRRSNERLRNARSKLQHATRQMKNEWCKAEELQGYVEAHMSRAFYNGLKAVYGPRCSGANPILSAYGSILHTTPNEILRRWKEHFQQLLNRPSTVDSAAIERLEQHPIRQDLDGPPTFIELQRVLKSLIMVPCPRFSRMP